MSDPAQQAEVLMALIESAIKEMERLKREVIAMMPVSSVRINHIIDPRTGKPLAPKRGKSKLKSITC